MNKTNKTSDEKFNDILLNLGAALNTPFSKRNVDRKLDTNEDVLTIWQCAHCDSDCAGESASGLCKDCEMREADKHDDQPYDSRLENYYEHQILEP